MTLLLEISLHPLITKRMKLCLQLITMHQQEQESSQYYLVGLYLVILLWQVYFCFLDVLDPTVVLKILFAKGVAVLGDLNQFLK